MKKYFKIALIAVVALIVIILIPFFVPTNYGNANLKNFDVIIVLGNPATESCSVSPIMKSRIDKGLELFKQDLAHYIIFTGDSVANSCIEAEVMAHYAEKSGVPDSCIIIEPKAQSTVQNAYYSVQIMKKRGFRSAAVVTNKFHCKRAAIIFSKYPIKYKMFPAELPGNVSVFQRIMMNFRENFILILKFLGLK